VKALLALTKSDDERVRLGAIQACLDRGWGRAVQGIEISGVLTVDTVKDHAPEWLSERLAGGEVEVIEDQVDEPHAEPVLLEPATRTPTPH